MQRRDSQRGQTAAEYLGVLVLIVVTVGVLVQAGIGTRIVDVVERQICELAASDDADCSTTSRAARQRALAKRRDPDGDGLSSKRERELGLAYNRADSDGDGVPDGQELRDGLDPKAGDTDRDGLSDGEEYREGTNPRNADGDDDGLTDAQEVAIGTKPGREWSDTEGGGTDGLDDYEEVYRYGTDPTKVDTDGDGDHDGKEIEQGSDPLIDERDLKDKVGEGVADAILDDPFSLVGAGGALKAIGGRAKGLLAKVLGRGDEAKEALDRVTAVRRAAAERLRRARASAGRTPGSSGPLSEAQVGLEVETLINGSRDLVLRKSLRMRRSGGVPQSDADFDALTAGASVLDRGDGLRTATVAGGTKITVRRTSSGGQPTLEIDTEGNPRIKIRY